MAESPLNTPDLPSESAIDPLVALLEPLARVTRPKPIGIERIPDDGGALFVGNHTIYGFLDLPFVMAELSKRRRMMVPGLGEHTHYAMPVWRDTLAMCGRSAARATTSARGCAGARTSSSSPGGASGSASRSELRWTPLSSRRVGLVSCRWVMA
jgi:hypothetical protein